jgi:hypothetical protein
MLRASGPRKIIVQHSLKVKTPAEITPQPAVIGVGEREDHLIDVHQQYLAIHPQHLFKMIPLAGNPVSEQCPLERPAHSQGMRWKTRMFEML